MGVIKMGKSDEDKIGQDELQLYIDNDSDLYRQRFTPIIKNLVKKKKKGVYNSIGATKAFLYLVVAGAKKYAQDFGGDWKKMFSVKDRLALARSYEKNFEQEYKYGNYT